jgi:rod shape-determining protein MreD
MWPQLGQRLDQQARATLPLLSGLLLTLLNVVVWPIPFFGVITPALSLVAVYYWAVYRPDLFTPLMGFALGLIHDSLNGLPLGLSALLFTAIHQLAYAQRRFFVGHPFFMLWAGFALTMVTVAFCQWLLITILQWQRLNPAPIVMQSILTITLFPALAWLLISLQRVVLRQV